MHYSSPAHALSLLGVLNEQRLKGQFCDVVLMAGEQRYPAHRNVLAASSEYFQTLFSRRDSENRDMIQLDFCEPEALEIVLNYIYSSSLFVDRGSLAVVQELGYSLGIPFLTNIMSTRPQVSYCVTRKRLCFPDEDESSFTQRSVIVHQGGTGVADRENVGVHRKASRHAREETQSGSGLNYCVSRYAQPTETGLNLSKNAKNNEEKDSHSATMQSLPSILKGRVEYRSPPGRPQLTSSVSFSETIQHLSSDPADDPAEDVKSEQNYDSKTGIGVQQGGRNQTVDRSGPLIKSLLRRSLSMDSPVPVFSPVLELKDSHNREQPAAVQSATNAVDAPSSGSKHHLPPLILRSKQPDVTIKEDQDAHGEDGVTVKTEASSPLADPSEIIRVTVQDGLPVNFRDFQANFDESPRPYFSPPGKRRLSLVGNSNTFKRTKVLNEHQFAEEDGVTDESPRNTEDQEPGELRPMKMFKCWSCMKVFRSNAGLYRHVNMYHNPEKPYACDICHKRFHTNFKVWTHCQTQHGVVQNPAASSSSYSVLDEKFQRKLIDIVREREIKKALIMKLRKNKQGHQAQAFAKKSRRSRSYGCPYCGKTFFFQSHFKLHMKGHTAERASLDVQDEEELREHQEQTGHVKENQEREVFPCRLCNVKLFSLSELEDHERACRYATVCPYCGLRFSSTLVKKDHEVHCKYKKLTCLECMRTFKSSFSIWRHQVEVHNQNMMSVREQLTFGYHDVNQETAERSGEPTPPKEAMRDDPMYGDSEDSSSYLPEDLSSAQGKLIIKEEPQEEPVMDGEPLETPEEPGVRPCEKCGKLFGSHKALERHQELLCHIKPFICHICHKAFRTNFRLWSHYQSHMSSAEEPVSGQTDRPPCSPPSSPTLAVSSQEPTPSQVSSPKSGQSRGTVPEDEHGTLTSSLSNPEQEKSAGDISGSGTDGAENAVTSQESDTLFYHAPTLSALTFKRQYMCKLCHRTFKTAFSLWSHEQSHGHI